ncbi:hypothetical protein DL1_05380 [Thioclava dalianensis]|uniref:DUF6473 domain-containing protein n=1 Tax=Thioclava dalianensis TaxID=1185766 RepID=A0A074TJL4_9RHOB|nr:DUF6473 family protein [Thioclava dalianensis]KEP69173.1 hypothetical protein DL1_05380 [Thioclava dalianensis]SFM91479.1 hypothetical protein SAMN05216224_101887 [Thioclava dalianensis]
MAFEYAGAGALDYYPCRYGKSKLLFRGPRRSLNGSYVAAIGGSETYGKFVSEPWPALLEQRMGLPVVNFGYMNAGIDVFMNEPQVTQATDAAQFSVIQLTGAQNMSNRFYAVHPRRNDRFLRASKLMRSIFRDIDFTEFNFTRHMLTTLKVHEPAKFAALSEELRQAWMQRMQALLERVAGRKVLLWLGEYRDPDHCDPLGAEPFLITRAMIDALRPMVDEVVRVDPSVTARSSGTTGMHFGQMEEPSALMMPGPMVHAEIAEALAPVARRML